MIRKSSMLFVALAVLLVSAPFASAAPTTWVIDPNHSSVEFSIRHLFSKVPGKFTKFSGTIVYDAANVASSSVKAEIDAASISTANEKRDGHLKSEDFFDVAKYPTIVFESTSTTGAGENKLKVAGNLTMHGVTKPVTLDVTFLGAGPGMGGRQVSGFEAVTKVNRKDFNIIWNRNLDQGGTLLGDDVDIRLNIEAGTPAPPEKKAEAGAAK
jgi:polyisoprenoid-binding protein YceI